VIPMKVSTPQIRARAVLALLAASLLLPGCSYNRFVSDEEAIKQAWSEVQNQLQRRTDLIPNLVETVKGIAGQEQEVFGRIADARARLAGARTPEETIQAANEQSSALARLLAVVENYPQLRSSESFNRLMDELAGTENRLSVARMRYNERIQQFNTLRRRFPSNIVAGVFGFKEYPYFEAPPEARQVPKVEFGK
jgi:LemA protein